MTEKVYIGGDMLTRAGQLLRTKEREEIKSLGYDFYNPMENKNVNDKANLDNNDGLAEKIVAQDTEGIRESDYIIMEPLSSACGTMVELGQIKGMKDLAQDIVDVVFDEDDKDKSAYDKADYQVIVNNIVELCDKILNQKVYPHYEDVRRFPGCEEREDRRAWGVNQYVYGVCLDLTDGKGFYDWNEIVDELKKSKEI